MPNKLRNPPLIWIGDICHCPDEACPWTGTSRNSYPRHRNEKHGHSKKFLCRRCGAGFPRKDNHHRHAGQCKGKKKNMERRGRKTNGVTPLEVMRALPGAPEEDIQGLMEMVDQGEANNAQLRANSLLLEAELRGLRERNGAAVSVSTQTKELSQTGEDGKQLHEFRAAFKEVGRWLHQVERKLERESEDRQLGEQILELKPKVKNLGDMAVIILEKFTSQRFDVESEMKKLGQRWETVVSKMDMRQQISLVGEEQINTTISQLVIPAPAAELEEIMTLPEEPCQTDPTPLKRSLPPDQSSPKRSLLTHPDEPVSTGSSQGTVTISSSSIETVSIIPRPVGVMILSTAPVKPRSPPPPPNEGLVDRTVPAELSNKVARVREAVSSVQKQLGMSLLTGKKFEKIEQQGKTLDRVKRALETLKPLVEKTEKELKLVSGSLSTEYFEKVTSQGEKCHEEWVKVNHVYHDKRRVWVEAKQELDTFGIMIKEGRDWLEEKENLTMTWKQVSPRS